MKTSREFSRCPTTIKALRKALKGWRVTRIKMPYKVLAGNFPYHALEIRQIYHALPRKGSAWTEYTSRVFTFDPCGSEWNDRSFPQGKELIAAAYAAARAIEARKPGKKARKERGKA